MAVQGNRLAKQKYNTGDKDLDVDLENIRDKAQEGADGNLEPYDKEITYDDLHNLFEGKIYSDITASGQRRHVERIGNEIWFTNLSPL